MSATFPQFIPLLFDVAAWFRAAGMTLPLQNPSVPPSGPLWTNTGQNQTPLPLPGGGFNSGGIVPSGWHPPIVPFVSKPKPGLLVVPDVVTIPSIVPKRTNFVPRPNPRNDGNLSFSWGGWHPFAGDPIQTAVRNFEDLQSFIDRNVTSRIPWIGKKLVNLNAKIMHYTDKPILDWQAAINKPLNGIKEWAYKHKKTLIMVAIIVGAICLGVWAYAAYAAAGGAGAATAAESAIVVDAGAVGTGEVTAAVATEGVTASAATATATATEATAAAAGVSEGSAVVTTTTGMELETLSAITPQASAEAFAATQAPAYGAVAVETSSGTFAIPTAGQCITAGAKAAGKYIASQVVKKLLTPDKAKQAQDGINQMVKDAYAQGILDQQHVAELRKAGLDPTGTRWMLPAAAIAAFIVLS